MAMFGLGTGFDWWNSAENEDFIMRVKTLKL